MTKALTKKHHTMTTRQGIMIGAMAGVVSALLPSIPTIVKFMDDTTPVRFLGQEMPYNKFLRGWIIVSVAGLGYIFWRVTRNRK